MSIAHVTGALGAAAVRAKTHGELEIESQSMYNQADYSGVTEPQANAKNLAPIDEDAPEHSNFHPYVKVCTNATSGDDNKSHRKSFKNVKQQWQKTPFLRHATLDPVWNSNLEFDLDLSTLLKAGKKEVSIKFEAWHRDLALTSHDDHIGSGKFCLHMNNFVKGFKAQESLQLHNSKGVPSGTLNVVFTWKSDDAAADSSNSDSGVPGQEVKTQGEVNRTKSPPFSASIKRKSSMSLYAVSSLIKIPRIACEGKLNVKIVRAFHLLDPNDNAMLMMQTDGNRKMVIYSFLVLLVYLAVGCTFFLLVEGPESTFARTPVVEATNVTSAVYPDVMFNTIMDVVYFSVCTFTTVGYGDVVPQTSAGRLFAVIYAIFGVGVVAVAINIMVTNCLQSSASCVSFLRGVFFESAIHEPPAQRPLTRSDVNRTVLGLFLKMLGVVIFGSIVFMVPTMMENNATEGLSFIDSLYMCTMTAASVGYGDISPKNQSGRTFLSIWLMGGYVIVAQSIVKISNLNQKLSQRLAEQNVLNRQVGIELLGMDTDNDGSVDLYEFTTHMAIAMGKMKRHEIDEIRERFIALDKTGDGKLSREDFMEFEMKRQESLASA